ncbi:MAG: DUF5004 domain-containing protein [Taibaiella sp.]|jgi:hypothetical protein
MKRLLPFLITIIACISLITSCQKKDEKLIIGKWEGKTFIQKTIWDSGDTANIFRNLEPNEYVIEFKKDKTYTSYATYINGSVSTDGSYSIAEDKLTMNGDISTFIISGNSLSIFTTKEEDVAGNHSHTESEMKLERK